VSQCPDGSDYMRRWLPLLLAGGIAGCVHYQPMSLSPRETAARLRTRTLQDPGLREFVQTNLVSRAASGPEEQWDLTTLTLAAIYYKFRH
jgi:outer membrane protein, heavy metal efflux system